MMKRLLPFLLLCASGYAQTVNITVTADTNRTIRTNFTIGNAQVTGLSGLLDAKQGTNATLDALSTNNAAALTNITAANIVGTVATASNITGILAISNGGTGSTSASNARTSLGLGSAATNSADAFQPASSVLTNLANGDGSGLTNVSGAANPTGDGGSLTNIAATNIVGSVPVASGGTGGTNADSALASLLPSYTSNAGKVLAVLTNETGVEWITAGGGGGSGTVTSVDASGGSTGMNFTGGPITTSGTLTLGGTLAIGSGGTGANDLTNARVNLLPAYTNNAGKVLAVNSSTNDIEWVSVPSSPVSIANGGTGGTNANGALNNLGVISNFNQVTLLTTNVGNGSIGIGQFADVSVAYGVAIGQGAFANFDNAVAIGQSAYVGDSNGVAIGYNAATYGAGGAVGFSSESEGGGAIGNNAHTTFGGAVGDNARSTDGFAGGNNARASVDNGVQLGIGTNTNANTIQFLLAGSVTTNSWSALANAGTIGTNVLQSTNAAGAQAAIFPATTTNAPTNTNAPTPDAWLDVTVGTNAYKLPLWQ